MDLIRSIPGVGEHKELRPGDDLLALVKEASQSVIVLCVSDKEELVEASGLLNALKPKTRLDTLRVLIFNAIEITKVHTHLVGQGCSDVLPYTLSRQGLIKKLHYNVVLLENARKSNMGNRRLSSGGSATDAGSSGGTEPQVTWVPAITTLSDCWLVRKSHVKSVLGNWFIELIGPGPSAGSWKSADADSTEEERVWEWVPRAGASEALLREPGKWQIVSKRPEFIWKVNRYKVIGKRTELRFIGEGGKLQWRFRTADSGFLEIAENSECAKGKLALIESTFDSSIVIKQDREKKAGGQDLVLTDEEGDILEHRAKDESREGKELSATRDKAASGSGIGLGAGGVKGYSYENASSFSGSSRLEKGGDFAMGADAFASIQLKVLIYPDMDTTRPGMPAELLEQAENAFVLDAPAASGKAGESLLADVISIGEKTTSTRVELKVDTEETVDDRRKLLFATLVGGNSAAVQTAVSTFEQRQREIQKFLEETRGF
jgi:hypothetical protein